MKFHKLAFTVTLMLSTTVALAADSAGTFAVKGAGLSQCSKFVAVAKSEDQAALSNYVGWIAGFITASNQHSSETFDLAPWQSIRTLTLALVNHCDRNADMRFGEAVVRMAASLQTTRLREKSELLPIEHEGRKHYVYKETVRRMQVRLQTLGLYGGALDGQFSEATMLALKKFQTEKEITASGFPDQKTMFELSRNP
jgi:hypothetical protein